MPKSASARMARMARLLAQWRTLRRRVVASSRAPDIVRFGLSPLYHRDADVRELVRRLNSALSTVG